MENYDKLVLLFLYQKKKKTETGNKNEQVGRNNFLHKTVKILIYLDWMLLKKYGMKMWRKKIYYINIAALQLQIY